MHLQFHAMTDNDLPLNTTDMPDQDYVLVECDLQPLESLVTDLETNFEVVILKSPTLCMTMVKAEDSVEFQPFYLGEALTTECELLVNNTRGIGICLGDEPVRSYCIAFIDAYTQLHNANQNPVNDFLAHHSAKINQNAKIEHALILRTKVDFKLMEQD